MKGLNMARELTAEQLKSYSSAIKQGFIDPLNPQLHSFCGTWTRKHPNRTTTLVRLRDIVGHNPQWEDLTDDVLSDLKDDMSAVLAPNSVRTICAELSAILRRNAPTKSIASQSFRSLLKHKKAPVQNVCLTATELRMLHRYVPASRKEAYVKEMFMRECLTGARSIDSRRLTAANIHEIDGVDYITYVAQKHPIEVSVPVHKWLRQYLHDDWEPSFAKLRSDHLCSIIRDIARKCGIDTPVSIFYAGRTQTGAKWKFLGTHTARRTFCTILYLRGVPVEDISQLMGHTTAGKPNISMTLGYVCATRKISNDIVNIFTK